MGIGSQFILIGALLFVNALLAGSEVALISLRESQIARLEERGARGRAVARLARDPNRFLATVQIGITLSGFLASATAAVSLAEPLLPLLAPLGAAARPTALVIITAALTFVTLVLGELAPKRIAMQRAEGWALATGGIILALARISRPLVFLLGITTDTVVRLVGADPAQGRDALTQEEIRDLIVTGGHYAPEERKIITGALEAADRVLREILRPRNAIVALPAGLPASEGLARLVASGHSRAPVYSDRIDDADRVVGVMDLVEAEGQVGDRARPVLALPESLGMIEALRRMQSSRASLALVVDEYGGVAGIVTVEDLLEELVGEIHDEYDRDVKDAIRNPDGSVTVIGRFPLHDLKDLRLAIDFDDRDSVTIAGLVSELLGRVPVSGDEVQTSGHILHVDEISGRSVRRVTIRPMTLPPVGTEPER